MSLGMRLAGVCRARDREILWAWAGRAPGPAGARRGALASAACTVFCNNQVTSVLS